MTKTADSQHTPVEMLDAGEARPWPVRLIALLLFFQALGLISLSIYNFDQATLQDNNDLFQIILISFTVLNQTLAFAILGLLTIVAGFGFLWLARTGWLTAMLVQGLVLLSAITIYLRGGLPYTFGLMGYSIFMVVYLHHPDVVQAFQTKETQEMQLDEAA
jgi:hypothetical protein